MLFFLKKMWSYVDGTSVMPTNKKEVKHEKDLETCDVKIRKSLFGSITQFLDPMECDLKKIMMLLRMFGIILNEYVFGLIL